MRSRKLPLIALAAVLTMTACASSMPPGSGPPRPLPSAYVAPPPPPPERSGNTPDDLAQDLKRMYDLYGQVAGRLVDLIEWLEQGSLPRD